MTFLTDHRVSIRNTQPTLAQLYLQSILIVVGVFGVIGVMALSVSYRAFVTEFVLPKRQNIERILRSHRMEIVSGKNNNVVDEVRTALIGNGIDMVDFRSQTTGTSILVSAPFLIKTKVDECVSYDAVNILNILLRSCLKVKAAVNFGNPSAENAVVVSWNEPTMADSFLRINWFWFPIILGSCFILFLISTLFLQQKILLPILSLKSLVSDGIKNGDLRVLADRINKMPIHSREIATLTAVVSKFLVRIDFQNRIIANLELNMAKTELARRLAHDIRGPLGALNVAVELAGKDRKFSSENERLARSSIRRINEVAEDILVETKMRTLAEIRTSDLVSGILELVQEIKSRTRMVKNNKCSSIEYESCGGGDDTYIRAHFGLIIRTISNLINNSMMALLDQNHGRVAVCTRIDSKYFTIAIEDNGVGMNESILNQIGAHQFTDWKKRAEVGMVASGSGLGVMNAFRVIKEFKGDIYVDSALNKGTIFTIRIPLLQKNHVIDCSVRKASSLNEVIA